MYSICSEDMREQFLHNETQKNPMVLLPQIDQGYANVMAWLIEKFGDGFDKRFPKSLDSSEEIDIAREYSRFLPSHIFKAYWSILQAELMLGKESTPIILDSPKLYVVDVGCGGGTFSLAVTQCVAAYQLHRIECAAPIYPVDIHILGIDPKEFALDLFVKSLEEISEPLERLLVRIVWNVVPGRFSENAGFVREMLRENHQHSVVLGMSNVIRPFEKQNNRLSEIKNKLLGAAQYLPALWAQSYREQVGAINVIQSSTNVDNILVSVIGSQTTDPETNEKVSWDTEIREFQGALSSQLTEGRPKHLSPQQIIVDATRPTRSYWQRKKDLLLLTTGEFSFGASIINGTHYLEDGIWQEVLDFDNLLLAWARARYEIRRGVFEDTLELKLFEININERIHKLQIEIRNYLWDALCVKDMLNFEKPKGAGKAPRPLSLGRIEDQVLSIAILQVLAKRWEKLEHPRSYGYRFHDKQTEYLYEYPFGAYQQFERDARQYAEQHSDHRVIRTDLSSYYSTIDQTKLLEIIQESANIENSRTGRLIEQLVQRDCGLGDASKGIPQGHSWSGFLGNIYLKSLDEVFDNHNQWELRYFRFVDDMIFIVPPGHSTKEIIQVLDSCLERLGVERSVEKTEFMSIEQFLENSKEDELLNDLSQSHNFLLSKLYKLDRGGLRKFREDRWEFVNRYQRLLSNLGVYLPEDRLIRKIRQNDRWWKRIEKIWEWWYAIKFPTIDLNAELDAQEWVLDFQARNESWINEYDEHKRSLLDLLNASLGEIQEGELPEKQALRRAKFAIYRLSQLGFDETSADVIRILCDYPELFSFHFLIPAFSQQGLFDELHQLLACFQGENAEQNAINRAIIQKAFRHLPIEDDKMGKQLIAASLEAVSEIERYMASEAAFYNSGIALRDSDQENMIGGMAKTSDSYLQKNYGLLSPKHVASVAANHRILHEVHQYTKHDPELKALFSVEPDVLYDKFYAANYPDDDSEFPEPPSQFR